MHQNERKATEFVRSPRLSVFCAFCSLTCRDADKQVGQVGVERMNVAQRLGPHHHAGEGHMWKDGCVFSSR